ncbi:MAG: hypothetical protein ACREVZ_08300 [Burkholderiales bacterium]
MSNRSLRARALQVASSVALCTFAIASQADPVSLQGVCHLSSIIAGQGRCDLYYQLADDFLTPGSARKSYVKVDGIIVAQYVNDTANPVAFSIPTVSGAVTVACGVTHIVTAYVAPVPTGAYKKVGMLPAVLCPTAP